MTRRTDVWAFTFLIISVLWFAGEMIWSDKVPWFRDLGPYFYPMRLSLAQSFQAGELPLWERHAAMGFPLLANFQSAAFYPPHLLFAVLTFFAAVRALFVFHYLVASIGAYKLCREWGYPWGVALTGGILFTFGGTIVSMTNLLNHFQTAVWLPWVVLYGDRCFRAQSWKSFLLLVAILSVQFLAGSPEIYAMSAALLLLDGVRLKSQEPAIEWKRIFGFFTAAHVTVAALTMVQILPTIELIRESRAQWPLGATGAAAWSFRPLELINLFFPDKQVDLQITPPLHAFFTPRMPFLLSHYMGALWAMGSLCWCWYAPRREKLVLSLAVFATFLLAAGDSTPIYSELLGHGLLSSLFRFPEKFFFITFALLIFVALRGIYEAFHASRPGKAPVWLAASMVLVFGFFYAWFRIDSRQLTHFIAWARGGGVSSSSLETATLVLSRLEMEIGITAGIFLLVAGKKFGLLRQSLFAALIVLFALVDLGSVHRPLQYPIKPDFVSRRSGILRGPDPNPVRLFYAPAGSELHPSSFAMSREPTFGQFNTLVFENLLPDAGVFYGFDYMQEIDALGRWPYTAFLRFAQKLPAESLYRLLGILNVKYVVRFFPVEVAGLTLERHFPQYPSWLYRIDGVLPRTYIVHRVIQETEPFKIMEQLSSAEFNAREAVIVDRRLEVEPAKGFKSQVSIQRYENRTVTLHASLDAPGVLVLADSFYPGWRVYVDGQEKEVLRANLFFRGVALAGGEHRVEFHYDPLSFRIGALVSLTTLLTLGAVLVLVAVKRKRQG